MTLAIVYAPSKSRWINFAQPIRRSTGATNFGPASDCHQIPQAMMGNGLRLI
jgi:hypothetical protein